MFQQLTEMSLTHTTRDRDLPLSLGNWRQLHEFLTTVENYDGLIGVDFTEYLYFDCVLHGVTSDAVRIEIVQYSKGRTDADKSPITAYWRGGMRAAFLPTQVYYRFLSWYGKRRLDLILAGQAERPHLYGKWDAKPMSDGTWHVSFEPQRDLDSNGDRQRFNYWTVSVAR